MAKDYTKEFPPEELEPFFPNEIIKFTTAIYFLLMVLFLLVAFLPVHPEVPANPFETPDHIKPEWYFLAVYQSLKLVPDELLGIGLVTLAGIGFILLPFIDRGKERRMTKRPVFVLCVTLGLLAFVALTLWGIYS